MAKTEAQKAADKRYKAKNYKNLTVLIKPAEYLSIDEFCKFHGISKARFIVWACNDFIKRGELPPESEVDQIEDYNDSDNNSEL